LIIGFDEIKKERERRIDSLTEQLTFKETKLERAE